MAPAPCKRIDGFAETEIDGEVVLMNLETGDFFSLTGTALSIWKLVDGVRESDAIAAELSREFAVDAVEIADDVETFLDQLGQAGLIARD